MENLKIFEYNGNKVTFYRKGELFVNATEMCKSFNAKITHFMENKQTIDFIRVLAEVGKRTSADLVVVTKGGNNPQNQGTWVHEKIALKLAAWLSPQFELWVYDRIHELLNYGITALPQTIDNIIANPEFGIKLLTELKQEREAKQIAQAKVIELQPKAEFFDTVATTKDTLDFMEASALLKMKGGRNKLFECLRSWDILMADKENMPYSQYIQQGYFIVKQTTFTKKGEQVLGRQTRLTEKGLQWLNKNRHYLTIKPN